MEIDGLIPFKSSTDQAMTSLYFLRILISFCSFSSVKLAATITSYALSIPKKAYFKCLANSFIINLSKFFSISCSFSSLLLEFSTFSSFRLKVVSFNSTLALRHLVLRSSIY